MIESEADSKAGVVAGSFLFRDLSPELLDRVVRLTHTQRCRRGTFVFHMGDEGDALYGVVRGMIRIWIPGADGRELTIALMERGDIFGEIALLDGLPRTANATAIDDTSLIAIDRPHFVDLLEREPRIARHIIELLCERLRATTDRFSEDAFLSLKARLAKRLEALMIGYGEHCPEGMRIGLKLSQTDLANMLGVTREAVNKQLGAWSQRGLIQHTRGTIIIRDPQGLKREASPEQS
ncbi:MAG TPA: Crp/Fnr family transcriptional regulator [Alphaproteobacteria bacterium]|nr:Crp/Fnr family transcriptional regulator [Alphaproteobacteria bacterium]